MLLADTAAGDSTGIPGWLNVAANVGGFALLAYYFLILKPKEDRILRSEINNERREQIADAKLIVNEFLGSLKEQRTHDASERKYEREQCSKQHADLARIVESGDRALTQAVNSLTAALGGLSEMSSILSKSVAHRKDPDSAI